MKANAVFEGGGMRGLGIIGALTYFEKQGYIWDKTAGTSAGALIAALIAAGYTPSDMNYILMNMDFNKFLDRAGFQKFPLAGKILGIFKDKGIFSGDYLEKWLNNLLNEKGISRFKDVYKDGEFKLKVIASDVTRRRPIIFPDDLTQYGYDPMEFYIARAIRMSISIPFYFKPIEFKYKNTFSYVVDGGICCNFPINIFDEGSIPEIPTFGFKFETPNISYTCLGKTDALSFLFDIASTMGEEGSPVQFNEKDVERTVIIPTVGVDSTEFDIPKEKGLRLYKSGYNSAAEFLSKWDFNKYLIKFYKRAMQA